MDRPVKDVIVTVVVAAVLAVVFMYVLLRLAFSGWGYPSPTRIDDSAAAIHVVRVSPIVRALT